MIRIVAAAGLAGFSLMASGCGSTSSNEQPSIYSATMKPVNPDVYPVIEGARPAATAQMSNDEAAGLQAHLTALGSARASGSISEAEYQRRKRELQALAANHGADTLKQIQN
ncbi:SHOCT domain-containing protein [Rhizobium sp. 32-5/1]|uniref:SHOCT domain-containing protein n=1 Tax=Rhizobium sp. 32-5/1 TaxID=3019602 RepID=UPI00240CF1B5|nr:SHOCT domain-containing protein [Rhizobium sp. 32-5/1]WEZ83549.1 SHOCT domain-containing protein [Rhizobium sp. 32-5/1]